MVATAVVVCREFGLRVSEVKAEIMCMRPEEYRCSTFGVDAVG